MPFAETTTGSNIHYLDLNAEADGMPVVLLHGLLGTGATHFENLNDWLVENGYRVIAPSLRGYGESTPKPRDFPYEFYKRDAKDVLAFLEAIAISRCHLLGYSDGGEIAFICAGTEPERFVSVTTIGAVGYMGPDVRSVMMGYRPGSQWIEQAEIDLHGIPDPDAFSAQWVRSMVMLVDAGGDVALSVAENITMPLLLTLGKKDMLNPRKYAEKFVEKVPNGKIETFDCGHPIHDQQTDAFRKSFLAHLKASE
ncbi:MAG: alpha/beta hydrolase [Chloroflexota bacterium]